MKWNVYLLFLLFFLISLSFEEVSCTKLDDGLQFVFIKRLLRLLSILPGNNCFSSCVHVLDDEVVEDHLVLCPLDDVLVHAAAGHQPEDLHLVLLTDPMSSRYGLQVVLRVEVRVVDDHLEIVIK